MDMKRILVNNIFELSSECDEVRIKFIDKHETGKRNYTIALGGIFASTISSLLLNINVVTRYQKLINVSLNILSIASVSWLYRFDCERNLLLSEKFRNLSLRAINICPVEEKNLDAKISEYEKLREEFLEERKKYY